MAPLVAKGHVYVGNSGGELGVRGWIVALDENSGKLLWKAYNTGPDKDVLIGPNSSRSIRRTRAQDLGVKTWPPEAWKIGGGNVWGWVTYDAELDALVLRQRQSRARGTPNSAPATTSGRPASSRAIPATARRAGTTR